MRLILTSDGLSSKALIDGAKAILPAKAKRGLIIPTASREGKDDRSIKPTKRQWRKLGITKVDVIDLAIMADASILLNYDVIIFLGGNPLYLLTVINRVHVRDILPKLRDDVVIIGFSAGTIIFQNDLKFFADLEEDGVAMNKNLTLTDFTGLGKIKAQIIPHWQYLKQADPRLVEAANKHQQKTGDEIIYLNDGEAIFIVDGNRYRVMGPSIYNK